MLVDPHFFEDSSRGIYSLPIKVVNMVSTNYMEAEPLSLSCVTLSYRLFYMCILFIE